MEEHAQTYFQDQAGIGQELQDNEAQIEQMKALIRQRREEIARRDEVERQLADQLAIRDSEIDRLQSILNERDMTMAALEDQMRQYGVSIA